MNFVPEEGKHLHEDCSTLILPALSIGNVGQLATDLLISSMGSERVGYLDDPYVLPCIAYESPSNALTIIQQRSPVIKGMMLDFAKNLADFIAGSGKKHIIVLSSLDFGKWQKVDMSSANSNGSDENCEQLGWKKLQEYDPSQKHWKYLSNLAEGNATREDIIPVEDELEEENYYASLPFAALFSFLKAKGLKVTCLLCYCSEGDNISDAFQLADAACKLLRLSHPTSGIEGGKWRVPLSWMSVYGPPPDVSIF
ncbi:Proteasome assembly chaperone 2, eukaryotic [Sesbania bispinosa]|nr:Proteasome assembly chaperone 2, eukaryotic [Sesbania bispinosa]